MGEFKKFNIARGELKEKKLQGEKQNSPTLQGGINLFTLIFIYVFFYQKRQTTLHNGLRYQFYQFKKNTNIAHFQLKKKKRQTHELLVSESKNRKRKLTREGCNTRIVFKRTIEDKYEVSKFYEGHSHGLVTPKKKQFLSSTRNVNNIHKNIFSKFIHILFTIIRFH